MRCSFSEAHLDAYVEGSLDPRRRARVAEHVASCAACAALLEEFRVIDALLLGPRILEPTPNFTFKVMAEVRALPPPLVRRSPAFAVLGTYVVFAWTILGAFFVFAHGATLATIADLGAWFVHAAAIVATVARATGIAFDGRAVDVTAAMGGLLAADAAVAAAIVAVYALVRARRLATARADAC